MHIPYSRPIAERTYDLRQSLASIENLTSLYMHCHGLLEATKDAIADGEDRWILVQDSDGYEAYLTQYLYGFTPDDRPDGFEDADIVFLGLAVMCGVTSAQITGRIYTSHDENAVE